MRTRLQWAHPCEVFNFLGKWARQEAQNTLVMDNLGYFQLKANPGAWLFRLRDGASAQIFDLIHQGSLKQALNVSVRSFRGTLIRPIVKRQIGKEALDVLNYNSRNSFWSTIKE